MFHPFNYVLCGNLIITERWALGSFYLIFEFTPLYGLYPGKRQNGLTFMTERAFFIA